MTSYQGDRNWNIIRCPCCQKGMRSYPVYDPGPFCKRKRCIKKRAKKLAEEVAHDMGQGAPAIKIRPLR